MIAYLHLACMKLLALPPVTLSSQNWHCCPCGLWGYLSTFWYNFLWRIFSILFHLFQSKRLGDSTTCATHDKWATVALCRVVSNMMNASVKELALRKRKLLLLWKFFLEIFLKITLRFIRMGRRVTILVHGIFAVSSIEPPVWKLRRDVFLLIHPFLISGIFLHSATNVIFKRSSATSPLDC